jgi:predicted enzyme related to lactoylglutathione lyase
MLVRHRTAGQHPCSRFPSPTGLPFSFMCQHLDIEIRDVDAEVERLERIGAHRLEGHARTEHGRRWVIMADPEGNEFCVCDGGGAV